MNAKAIKINFLFLCFVFIYTSGVKAATRGEKLYTQNCMVCHADDGSSAMPGVSDLNENRAWITMDEKTLLSRLKKGIQKPGATMVMPAKGGNQSLTDKDLEEIIRYMRQTFFK